MDLHLHCDENTASERTSVATVDARSAGVGEVRSQEASLGAAIFFAVFLAFALRWIFGRWRRANPSARERSARVVRTAPPPIALHTHPDESRGPTAHGARVDLSPTAGAIQEEAPQRAPPTTAHHAQRPPPIPRAEFKSPIAHTRASPSATTHSSPAARSNVQSDQEAAARAQSHAEWADEMRARIRRSARGS
jgi:hypothetical protein